MVLRLNWGTGYTETQQDITGATTILPPTELLPGRNVVYFLDQDGTGSHSISFDPAFQFDDGFTLPITDAANKRRTLQFVTTFGGTLVYNQDFTTDVPGAVPTDWLSNFLFDGDGVDLAGYWPTIPTFGNVTFTTVGISATGASNSAGASSNSGAAAAPVDMSDERSFSFWFDGSNFEFKVYGYGAPYSFSSGVGVYNSGGTLQIFIRSYWYSSPSSSSASRSAFVSTAEGSNMDHIVVTRNNSEMKVYLNKVEVGSTTAAAAFNSMAGFPGATYQAEMYEIILNNVTEVDELKLYDRVLSQGEIDAIYDAEEATRKVP